MMFKNCVLFRLLYFLCLFSACLLLFLCLGPSGTLKPLFLSIQMFRHLPRKGAPRASQERSKTIPRVSRRTLLPTKTFELVQKCLVYPKDFHLLIFDLSFGLFSGFSLPVFRPSQSWTRWCATQALPRPGNCSCGFIDSFVFTRFGGFKNAYKRQLYLNTCVFFLPQSLLGGFV